MELAYPTRGNKCSTYLTGEQQNCYLYMAEWAVGRSLEVPVHHGADSVELETIFRYNYFKIKKKDHEESDRNSTILVTCEGPPNASHKKGRNAPRAPKTSAPVDSPSTPPLYP